LRYGGCNNNYLGPYREVGMNKQEERKSRKAGDQHPESQELRHLWGVYVEHRPKGYLIRKSVLITAFLSAVALILIALFIDDDLAWSVLLALRDHVTQIVHYTTNDIPHAFGVE
jgi:hypothetical protein